MKFLLLARHAHASAARGPTDDRERPLSARGSADALRLGRWIRDEAIAPDVAIVSDATRATASVARILETCGSAIPVRSHRALYLASPDTWISSLRTLEPSIGRVLAVGHNPGIEDLLARLTGERRGFGTADLAEIHLPIDGWDDLDGETRGSLARFRCSASVTRRGPGVS